MSRFSPTVAPNAGEAFGRALQQSVGAFLQARQQKQTDEAEMLGRGYVPVDTSPPIKGPHTPPIVEPQAPAINQGALDTLVQKNTPQDVQAPTQAGQSFGAMLGAQAMPIQVAQSKPQPVGVSPQALSKAAGLDAYSPQPAQPSPVHLLGRDWQMTPQAMASMQASQEMARASLDEKLAGTAKTRRETAKPQLGDPDFNALSASEAGAKAAATLPFDVSKAVSTAQGTAAFERAPRSFAVNGTPTEGFSDKAGNFYDANGKRVTGTITPFVHPLATGAVDSNKRFGADQANKILDDYSRDTKDFHQVMGGWDVLQGAVKDPSLATPFAVTDAYARITNPGAIVRPTTMDMIHQMGSVGQRMEKFWSQNKDGALPPDILRDFQKTLYNIVSEHKKQFDQIRTKAVQRGKDAGVDVTPYLEDYTVNDPVPKGQAVGGGRVRDPGGDINLGDTSVNPFASLVPKKKP